MKSRGNFSFKSFTVVQEHAPMPVTTDACILGAYANFPDTVGTILDVGTGTGLLSLMLAQRYAQAHITGIDIQAESAALASLNFEASPWEERLSACNSSLQSFNSAEGFDGLVCNPPFFDNQLASTHHGKRVSRHTVSLTYNDLFMHSNRLLKPTGIAWYLLPTLHEQRIYEALQQNGFFHFQRVRLYPSAKKSAHLMLLACKKTVAICEDDQLITYSENGRLTHRMAELLRPFYLHL